MILDFFRVQFRLLPLGLLPLLLRPGPDHLGLVVAQLHALVDEPVRIRRPNSTLELGRLRGKSWTEMALTDQAN